MNAGHRQHDRAARHYRGLLIMGLVSFVSMYVLMYAMVNAWGNVYNNVNQVYMAGVMTSPMLIIELLVMRGMYGNRRLNLVIVAVALAVGISSFLFIRQQAAVGDRQFLRSMIPHHAGAILMCREAPLRDPEIQALCRAIISSQQSEIDQMKAKLQQLAAVAR
jgi:uncharacterized protein (DUF305 family)